VGTFCCLEGNFDKLTFRNRQTGMLTQHPGFFLVVGLAAGHEALDFASVVRIHDHQLVAPLPFWERLGEGFFLVVGLAAGREALDFVSVVRIHDHQLIKS
jgi:hypothetical protein